MMPRSKLQCRGKAVDGRSGPGQAFITGQNVFLTVRMTKIEQFAANNLPDVEAPAGGVLIWNPRTAQIAPAGRRSSHQPPCVSTPFFATQEPKQTPVAQIHSLLTRKQQYMALGKRPTAD